MSVNPRCPKLVVLMMMMTWEKNKSHFKVFPQPTVTWLIDESMESVQATIFAVASVVLASGMTLLVFAKNFNPDYWLLLLHNWKTKKRCFIKAQFEIVICALCVAGKHCPGRHSCFPERVHVFISNQQQEFEIAAFKVLKNERSE